MVQPPESIDGFLVVEFGFFPRPMLPAGYVPHPDGRPALRPIQNLAICTSDGIDGYYLLYCTPDWTCVTYQFEETIEAMKKSPAIEFAQEVVEWHKRDG